MKFLRQSILSFNYSICLLNKNGFNDIKRNSQICNYLRTFYRKAERPIITRSLPTRISFKRTITLSAYNFISPCILNAKQDSQVQAALGDQFSSNDKMESKLEEIDTKKDQQNRRRAIKFSVITITSVFSLCGIALIIIYGKPTIDEHGREYKDAYSQVPMPFQYVCRAYGQFVAFRQQIREPIRELLLPDPLKDPYIQPPYTLVLEMKDILVHPEWTYQTGWRFKKRPGVDFLLQHCAPPLFEIVIYTNEQGFTAYPVLEQLDPNGFIWYKLFKDSTRYEDGKHLKDLTCLNRDLKKVVLVDWDKNAVISRRNQLCLKPWKGNMDDQTLIDLGLMLRTIAESGVDDVREVLDYYKTFDDPLFAFRENQRAAQEQELARQKRVEESSSQKSFVSGISSNFLKRR